MTVDRKPWFAVEAKLGADRADPSVHYFRKRLEIPRVFQLTLDGNCDSLEDGVRCLPADLFLAYLV